ncbi:hypothetical protein GcC1_062023 [Golovinomyces cichoracearum]|uniref:Uncharacterized protein n=1 Tax=Golovinomyces cichoracearum TaxID=62708 RepID=A0A420ISN6_9PEZI|nr:hypothetical protein GcC1_062023 [Golovinomyces cichoracearum]
MTTPSQSSETKHEGEEEEEEEDEEGDDDDEKQEVGNSFVACRIYPVATVNYQGKSTLRFEGNSHRLIEIIHGK